MAKGNAPQQPRNANPPPQAPINTAPRAPTRPPLGGIGTNPNFNSGLGTQGDFKINDGWNTGIRAPYDPNMGGDLGGFGGGGYSGFLDPNMFRRRRWFGGGMQHPDVMPPNDGQPQMIPISKLRFPENVQY